MMELKSKPHKVQEMTSEYRFDYKKAKPNHFAGKMNLDVGQSVEKFVESAKEKEQPAKKKASAN